MSRLKAKRVLRWVGAAVLSALLLASSGNLAHARRQNKITPAERESAIGMLDVLHDALKKNYYDPTFHGVDMDARFKVFAERVKTADSLSAALRAIEAYLVALDDSHTHFLPPEHNFHFDYGYRMQMIADQCFITQVRPGSDAAAKLHPGDQVLSLDGYAVKRKDLWQLEYYVNALAPKSSSFFELRDPAGARRSEEVSTLRSVSHGMDFSTYSEAMNELEKRRRQMRDRFAELDDAMIWKMRVFLDNEVEIDHLVGIAKKHQALILDLRGNGGGSLDTLRYLIGSLIDHDVHIGTSITRKEKKPLDAKSHGKNVFTGKLIVLIDARSASASEVLARVVQLEHRGTIVGDRSDGSVMEAQIYPLRYGVIQVVFFGAEITRADLLMSDGKSLEKIGVTPDVLALPTAADLAAGRDPVLAKAAELARAKLDPEAAGKLFPYEWPPE